MTHKVSNKVAGITPGVIDYDARSFIINGKRELLVGGEFHYFRTPRELWEDRIIKMKRSGSNLVTTYIAWNWHEPIEGKYRWTGDQDLGHFIELCQKHDMFVVVKPGPYICAEWDFGGHPDWLLSKGIPLRVLNDAYLKYVAKWYATVAKVINPYLITNGGRVIAIQVENEYDHLMHFGEEKITEADAIEYFKQLKGMMDKGKIDIPKFANEAAFLRGSGIIDTRTYYPSIPWFWQWELNNYDNNILLAKEGQPDCPTMILELQSGWFTMFGQPPFDPPPLLTEAVTYSSLAVGASLFNLYMFVGGTTFPFWTCRGDIFDLYPPGTGTTTSFDFGGSPIREWGELMPGRYDWVKIFNMFCQNFKDLLVDSDVCEDISAIGGGKDVRIIGQKDSFVDEKLSNPSEKFGVVINKKDDQYLACIRNMSDEDKVVDLGWAESEKAIFRNVEVKTHETFMLPVGVKIPHTEIRVEKSTSGLLFAHPVNDHVVFGVFGKKDRKGETVLNVPASKVKVLSGKVKVSGKNKATLKYIHDGMQVLKVGKNMLVILEQDLASKVELLKDGVLVADTYFVKDMKRSGSKLSLKTQMRNDSKNDFYLISDKKIAAVKVGGKKVSAKSKPSARLSTFSSKLAKEDAVSFKWTSNWKMKADIAEAAPEFNDSKWASIDGTTSLENAEFFRHGYIWYRQEFNVSADAENVTLKFKGNNTDRMIVYVNGEQVWFGITERSGEVEQGIQGAVKPGKNVIAILYENFYHNKSHPHEGDILKHSGILYPMSVEGTSKGKAFKKVFKSFKVREGLNGDLKGFAKNTFKDTSWLELEPSHKYVMDKDLGDIVWMRRSFSYKCKKGWETGVKITIPDAKDRVLMFINGRPLGQFEHIGPQYDFYIPEPYLQEENVLTFILEGSKTFMDVCRGYLIEPEMGTFYEVKDVPVTIDLK